MAEDHDNQFNPMDDPHPSGDSNETPKAIGPYKIESLLEKGGMSILYLGTHPETGDPVTIKVLSPQYLSRPEAVKRFLTEAEIIAMADHPNIVKLYGYGEWSEGLYIAMEFIQGISLRQYILQTPTSLKRSLEIILDIAFALCHLHTHGIIHRDVKPENILVTETSEIKVIDFGIAQLLTNKERADMPSKQRMIGTPIYMSPEQRENPEAVSYPSDIYSLGIISYELVLGKLSHGQIHLSLMPKGLQKILNKALQLKPEDRYQDIVDFISDMTAYLHSSTIQKEKKIGDQLGEFSENLKLAQNLLVPVAAPSWKGIDMGFSYSKGILYGGFYCDFIELSENVYGIVLGEPSSKGAPGLIHTAMLQGMFRALCRFATEPAALASLLNDLIIKENLNQIFALSFLVLNASSNTWHYLSCGFGSLWVIPAGLQKPEKIVTENLPLGVEQQTQFSAISHSWHPGDLLILTNAVTPAKEEESLPESLFIRLLVESNPFTPKKQADLILRRLKISAPPSLREGSMILICLQRV